MKRVTLEDGPVGNSRGWDPNGATTFFTISEPAISSLDSALTSMFVSDNNINHFCDIVDQAFGGGNFNVSCSTPPSEVAELHYVVENLPSHVSG